MAISSGLLAYIKAFRQRAALDSIRDHVLGKYSAPVVRAAKDTLWENCQDDLSRLNLEKRVRRTSPSRPQELADLDDILEAFDALDDDGCLPDINCSSEDLLLMPQLLPVVGLEQVTEQLRCFNKDISSRLESISQMVSQSSKHVAPGVLSASSVSARKPSHSQPADQLERRSNLIMFGVPEDKDISIVSEVLEAVAGNSIAIKDTFRLGKKAKASAQASPALSSDSSSGGASQPSYRSGQEAKSHPRPILIKLNCPWDRRIILASKKKLLEIEGMEKYFLQPDLTLEERRKRREAYLARKSHSAS